jgi:hypothetical protein
MMESNAWILNAVWGLLLATGLFILHGISDSLKDLNRQIRELNTVVVNGLSSLDRRTAIAENGLISHERRISAVESDLRQLTTGKK